MTAARVDVHQCHALRCTTPVPADWLMCETHWAMVPEMLKNLVWSNYRPGQEIDKQPSSDYLTVAWAAVDVVADLEAREAAVAP